jgi:hypothetical protein
MSIKIIAEQGLLLKGLISVRIAECYISGRHAGPSINHELV